MASTLPAAVSPLGAFVPSPLVVPGPARRVGRGISSEFADGAFPVIYWIDDWDGFIVAVPDLDGLRPSQQGVYTNWLDDVSGILLTASKDPMPMWGIFFFVFLWPYPHVAAYSHIVKPPEWHAILSQCCVHQQFFFPFSPITGRILRNFLDGVFLRSAILRFELPFSASAHEGGLNSYPGFKGHPFGLLHAGPR